MSSTNGSGNPHGTFTMDAEAGRVDPLNLNLQSNYDKNKSGSVLTQDLTSGFEPKYRGSIQDSGQKTGNVKVSVADDPWAIQEMENTSVPWKDLDGSGKIKRVVISIAKLVAVMTLLYFFICSLDCLSTAFQLVSGSATSDIFQQDSFVNNPVVGMMIGIITTVLVQSSSTSTSIIVSMVAAGILEVEMAIPIVMGANVGTSITNTIVSLTQVGDRNQFRRAFAGATVHDMFNWLTVIILLIVEVTTGFLLRLTTWVTDQIFSDETSGSNIKLLSVLTDPFVDLIVKTNSATSKCWADPKCNTTDTLLLNCDSGKHPQEDCEFLFAYFGFNDQISGAILLVSSLVVLCGCLILIVKVLQSVMRGQIANIIKKTLNAKIPYVPWLTGYLALGVGAVMTFLVQSSSVFTSTLTPLVGLGVISIERVYPLTLGSNIGTTTTALLAAMSVEGEQLRHSLQIALCHLFFNISGILLFYPIPFMRFPIAMAKFLGETTAKYRWFAIAYMVVMFLLLPAFTMGLSLADPSGISVIVFATLLFLIFAFIIVINVIRKRRPSLLPEFLQSWKFLPVWLRSLEPYDRIFTSWSCCKKLRDKDVDPVRSEEYENPGFEFEGGANGPGKSNNLTLVQVNNLRPAKNGHSNLGFSE